MDAFQALQAFQPDHLLPSTQPTLLSNSHEPWRWDRLHRVVGFLVAFNVDPLALVCLEDHKGELVVTSKRVLTCREQAVLYSAWGSIIGDGADENVTFHVAA